mgnify:CR=1 FL=1
MKILSAQNPVILNQSKFHNVKPNVVVSDFSSKNNNVVKSGVLSANYFSPSFGASPASLELATKKMYNAMGCNYLLPNQVWSKTKILDTISSFAEKFEKIIDKNIKSKKIIGDINYSIKIINSNKLSFALSKSASALRLLAAEDKLI